MQLYPTKKLGLVLLINTKLAFNPIFWRKNPHTAGLVPFFALNEWGVFSSR